MQVDDVHYSAVVSAGYRDSSAYWLKNFESKVENAIESMADSVLARARITVPRKNGDLGNTGRVEGQGLTRLVIYGDENVRYAGYQERGMRIDGSRVVKHYTTPGTGSHYLRNAFESVLKEGIRSYIK